MYNKSLTLHLCFWDMQIMSIYKWWFCSYKLISGSITTIIIQQILWNSLGHIRDYSRVYFSRCNETKSESIFRVCIHNKLILVYQLPSVRLPTINHHWVPSVTVCVEVFIICPFMAFHEIHKACAKRMIYRFTFTKWLYIRSFLRNAVFPIFCSINDLLSGNFLNVAIASRE